MTHNRPGTTLLELCVTIAIMAVIASVVTLAARRVGASSLEDAGMRIANARRVALATGQPVLLRIMRHDSVFAIAAHPDGSIVADSSLHLDRLTGRHRRDTPTLPAADHTTSGHSSVLDVHTGHLDAR